MVTGWKEINTKDYFFKASGVMKTNAFTPDGYYVEADGAYLRNQKIEVDGKEYYLNAAGKELKINGLEITLLM